MWVNGQIGNCEYLLLLNDFAHRSLRDLSQYPVFPWIVSDFSSEELDLESEETFRDLSTPIGALSEEKLEKFKNKYFEIVRQNADETPYLFNTHYSTPGIVLYYLIRKVPQHILRIQSGGFGPVDRIFFDVESCFNHCLNVLSDNKELIPEFYVGNGEFLKNLSGLDLGKDPHGDDVSDVVLPPWSNNAEEFVL